MPIYSYTCPVCHFHDDHVRPMDKRNESTPCPVCAADMERDFLSERTVSPPETPYSRPFLSEALGVAPNQVDDARRRFPDHKFLSDGRMVIESHKERKQVLKDLGFVDRG